MKMVGTLLFIAVLTIPAALFAYDDPDAPPIDSKISSGLAACRTFASGYQYQSPIEDREDFQDKFGPPRDMNISPYSNDDVTVEYNYDSFTKVTLECHGSSCRARCASKY